VRTLFVSYRVTDLERSLCFYTALGYGVLGRGEVSDGSRLVILKFPEETMASLEQVHRPADGPSTWAAGSTTSRSRWTVWPAPWKGAVPLPPAQQA
jgi:lactoylglutathione lyase